ncbi:hypothetical protein C0J52_17297, partial [Blattella germanica]
KRGASAERRDSLDIIDTAVPRKVEEVKKKPKNKKKWKETHECCLDPELDEVQTMYSGRTFEAKFKRWFVRLTLVSPSNPLTKIILQSEAAIRQERFRQLASYPYVVHPFSRTRSIWEVIMVFVFYISIMEVPMNTSFNLSIYEYFRMFDFMLDCICLVDCMFTFFCGYYDKFTHEVHLKPSTVANSWIIKLQLVNSSNWQRYYNSLFRGVTIAFNTATGSVPPRTLEDIYYTCFALITGQKKVQSNGITTKRVHETQSSSRCPTKKNASVLFFSIQKEILSRDRNPRDANWST